MRILFINLLFITLILADVKVGEGFPSLALLNQQSKKVEIPKKGEVLLLISFEKDTSTAIQEFLKEKKSDFLSANNMMYISDISSLPSFLVNLFVLPKLKKFDFEVALIYDENELDREEEKITVIHIKDNNVTSISFIEVHELEKFMVKPTSF